MMLPAHEDRRETEADPVQLHRDLLNEDRFSRLAAAAEPSELEVGSYGMFDLMYSIFLRRRSISISDGIDDLFDRPCAVNPAYRGLIAEEEETTTDHPLFFTSKLLNAVILADNGVLYLTKSNKRFLDALIVTVPGVL